MLDLIFGVYSCPGMDSPTDRVRDYRGCGIAGNCPPSCRAPVNDGQNSNRVRSGIEVGTGIGVAIKER